MGIERSLTRWLAREPDKIELTFDMLRDFNLAQRTYSADWNTVWLNWVDREVDIVNERYDKQRARAYFGVQ